MKFHKGDQVSFRSQQGEQRIGTFSHITPQGDAYITVFNDDGTKNNFWRKPNKINLVSESTNGQLLDLLPVGAIRSIPKYSVKERFEKLESLVEMVVAGEWKSLIISGEGGLGKTYTVKKVLERAFAEDMQIAAEFAQESVIENEDSSDVIDNTFGLPFKFIKGFSTAKGLYRSLYENNGKIIIYDDCDKVLKVDIAVEILKAALDSYDERIISWITSPNGQSAGDLPESFTFTGMVIFITNMPASRLEQPIISRSMCVDLNLTMDEKIEYMHSIIEELEPGVDLEIKRECLEFIESVRYSVKELTLRTFIQVISIRMSKGANIWRSLAEFTICKH